MLIVGLTGSMGMGKSTAAQQFRARGYGVFDADAEVHKLYAGPLAAEIESAFPGTVEAGKVDRAKLSALLVKSPERLEDLERIVHPHVRNRERAFLRGEAEKGAKLAILEIPLLFESGADQLVDAVVVVSAPEDVQKARVMARPGMSEDKYARLLQRQTESAKKRERADFVVDTGGTIESCHAQIDVVIGQLLKQRGSAFVRHWG